MNIAAGRPGTLVLDLRTPSPERRGRLQGTGVRIERVSLSELLERIGWDELDVLKVDIEGDEFELFSDPAAARAHIIVGELHEFAAPSDFAGLAPYLPEFDVRDPELAGHGVVMFRAIRRT